MECRTRIPQDKRVVVGRLQQARRVGVVGIVETQFFGINFGCRPECGWNLRGLISSDVKLSDCRFAFK